MNRSPERPCPRAGFTLVEMVFVLVLLAIVAGFAVPRMSGVVNWSRLDRSAQQLVGDVVYARAVAVQSADRVAVEFTGSGYRLRREGAAGALKSVDLAREHSGTTLVVEGGTGTVEQILGRLTFDSRGVLREGEGTRIVLGREGRQLRLEVTSIGQVKRVH